MTEACIDYNTDVNGCLHSTPMCVSGYTEYKHKNFNMFIELKLPLWGECDQFRLIDLTAGAGKYPNGKLCMCWRFIKQWNRYNSDKPLIGAVFEKDEYSRSLLRSHLRWYPDVEIRGDNSEILEYESSDRGLIIYDPNGCPDFKFLDDVLTCFPNMDLFVHLHPAFSARKAWRKDYVPLSQDIKSFDKNNRRIMLTRKYGRYMDLISVVDDLSNVYVDKCDLFNALNSYEGQSILEEINYGHIV